MEKLETICSNIFAAFYIIVMLSALILVFFSPTLLYYLDYINLLAMIALQIPFAAIFLLIIINTLKNQ